MMHEYSWEQHQLRRKRMSALGAKQEGMHILLQISPQAAITMDRTGLSACINMLIASSAIRSCTIRNQEQMLRAFVFSVAFIMFTSPLFSYSVFIPTMIPTM